MNCGHCILITRNNIDEDVHLLMKQNDPRTKVKKINKKVNAWTSLFPYAIQQRHVLFFLKNKMSMLAMAAQRFFCFFKREKREKNKRTGRKAWPVSLDIYVDIHIHLFCSLSVSMFVNMIYIYIYICTLQFRHILYTSQSINIWNVEIIRSDYIQITISKYIISQYINTHTHI
jgi:hypothetical protein